MKGKGRESFVSAKSISKNSIITDDEKRRSETEKDSGFSQTNPPTTSDEEAASLDNERTRMMRRRRKERSQKCSSSNDGDSEPSVDDSITQQKPSSSSTKKRNAKDKTDHRRKMKEANPLGDKHRNEMEENPVETMLASIELDTLKKEEKFRGLSEEEMRDVLRRDIRRAIDSVVAISAAGSYRTGWANKGRRISLEAGGPPDVKSLLLEETEERTKRPEDDVKAKWIGVVKRMLKVPKVEEHRRRSSLSAAAIVASAALAKSRSNSIDQKSRSNEEVPKNDYAKSYILPKIARKSSNVKLRRKKKSDENFKLSMVRASLDYLSSSKLPPLEEKAQKVATTERRLALRHFEAAEDAAKKKKKPKHTLKSYIDYVQDENYVPEPMLEPEKGMATSSVYPNQLPVPASVSGHQTIMEQFESILLKAEEAREATKHLKRTTVDNPKDGSKVENFDKFESLDFERRRPTRKKNREWQDAGILQDALTGNNLLAMLEEPQAKFGEDSSKVEKSVFGGPSTLDLFIDRSGGGGGEKHPALQNAMKELNTTRRDKAEKLRVQEDLFRLRAMRKEGENRREHLLSQAKVLQTRATKHKEKTEEEYEKLAVMWEAKLNEELTKSSPLEQVCAALREELDAAHRQRIEAFEIKMKPIIIRDGPSRKANYKIQAARLHYDIYALTQRLRHTTMRAEHEEQRRERREREVRRLREEISQKKTAITTVTKGVPFTKIEVRPEDQIPQHSFRSPSPPHRKDTFTSLPRSQVMAPLPVAAGTVAQQRPSYDQTLPQIGNGNLNYQPRKLINGRLPQQNNSDAIT